MYRYMVFSSRESSLTILERSSLWYCPAFRSVIDNEVYKHARVTCQPVHQQLEQRRLEHGGRLDQPAKIERHHYTAPAIGQRNKYTS